MRYHILAVTSLLLAPAAFADTRFSLGISTPGISIGFSMPTYPSLVPIPGTPVYYDPDFSANYFFYDGYYWVFQGDDWYASSWYDGPWSLVARDEVPLFLWRVPVRYYRQPPVYFRAWQSDDPPRWGEHWGASWEQRHSGWDHWDRRAAPRAAPLPSYQRAYSGERYPRAPEQQRAEPQPRPEAQQRRKEQPTPDERPGRDDEHHRGDER